MPPANVVFEPWVITPTQATINWTAFSDTVTPIDHVEYRVWRDIDTPVVQSTTDLVQSHTLNVTNFQGTVFAEVVVVDAQSNTTTRLTQFAVNNKVKPTPPDWLTFSSFTGLSVNLQWGAAYYPWVHTTITGAEEVDFTSIDKDTTEVLIKILTAEVDDATKEGVLDPKRAEKILDEIGNLAALNTIAGLDVGAAEAATDPEDRRAGGHHRECGLLSPIAGGHS